MNKLILLAVSFMSCTLIAQNRTPIKERVNVQSDSARISQIIDGE